MKRPTRYLTTVAVKAIHDEVIAAHGGAAGIRDERLLDSAVAAPRATFDGEPLFRDPIEIAAAYLFYLSSNHPFIDGNKRTALATCLVFLEEHDVLVEITLPKGRIDDWEALVMAVSSSQITRDETTRRLRSLLRHKREV